MSKIDVDAALRELDAGTMPQWIADHLRTYLESGGSQGHMWDSTPAGGPGLLPTLILNTRGRRSGQMRPAPLIYGTAGDDYIVIASKGGAPEHPAWYTNLEADSNVTLQVGENSFDAVARTAAGSERETLWKQMVALYPPYADYQQKTTREIPVVVISRAA